MNGASHEKAIKKQVQIYILVFVALACLTALTVGVSYLRLPLTIAIVVALLIACVKSSLVAGFFMHLVSERKIVYWILALAFILFIFLLSSPSLHRF